MSGFNLGALLEQLTGGGAFGGGFMGDMKGIGHSMMEHYRQGQGQASPPLVQGFAPNPITAPAAAPGPTIIPPHAPIQTQPNLQQIMQLLSGGAGGPPPGAGPVGGYWGTR